MENKKVGKGREREAQKPHTKPHNFAPNIKELQAGPNKQNMSYTHTKKVDSRGNKSIGTFEKISKAESTVARTASEGLPSPTGE